jgi:prolipoprotein diacylglyceryl transferase
MHWDIDPIITQIGAIELRWYGLFFATGLLLCAWKAPQYFQLWGLPKLHAERLTLWVPVGMLLGAHYIHLLFYETEGLLDFRFEVHQWFPPDVTLGRFWALGSGLASHGGALGCVLALLIFWYRNGRQYGFAFHRYADAVMVTSIWVYGWVRLGNFFNSEIYGRETTMPWGVIFDRHGFIAPRHPVQLYEAFLYFAELAFAVLWFQPRFARRLRPGTTFYLFLAIHFSLRFFCEFFKETQGVDDGWALNMGHLLSLPIVVACLFVIFATKRFSILAPLTDEERAAIEASAARSAELDAEHDAEAARKRGEAPAEAGGSKKGGGKKKSKKRSAASKDASASKGADA